MFKLDSPFMNFLNKVCDLLILNILALICCIPIITAGASLTAVYYMTYKMLKNEEGYIAKGFFKAFKENFKQSTAIWLIQLVIIVVLIMDFRIIVYSGLDFGKPLVIAVVAGSIVFLLGMTFALPLQARFSNTVRNTIKNSFLMFLSHLPTTVLLVVIVFVPFLIMYFINAATPLVALLGISVVAYTQSFFILRVFRPYEETEESKQVNENEEEVDALEQDENLYTEESKDKSEK